MANYTPEGISPRFSSIVCPDIPDSFKLEWTFRPQHNGDGQNSAKIEIFYAGESNQIAMHYVGDVRSFDLKDTNVSWEQNRAYEWQVTTYNHNNIGAVSVRGKFYYAESPEAEPITWDSGPEAYEKLGSREYFNRITQNALIIMSDYKVDSTEEQSLYNKIVEKLFVGEVVPTRSDFILLEEVIRFLYLKENFRLLIDGTKWDVDSMAENGLGAGDIHLVYELLNLLTKKMPNRPTNIDITIPAVNVPSMTHITFSSAGKEDTSVDLSWGVNQFVDNQGTIKVSGLSSSEDVRYYYCEYSYGNRDNPYVSKMYYRPEDLAGISYSISFDFRYEELFTASTISRAHHNFTIRSIDVRNNSSDNYSEGWYAPYDFKSPLGHSYYEIQFERAGLTATGYNPNAHYYYLYNGGNFSATHTLATGQEGVYFYRVRYVDLSGQTSGWVYSSGNKFDPLKPPAAPTVWLHGQGYNNIHLAWSAVSTAEYYEIHRYRWTGWWGNPGTTVEGVNIGTTTSHDYNNTGLPEKTIYAYYVRAINRAGHSEWTGVSLNTLERPPVEIQQKAAYAECWRTPFSVNGKYYSGGWRNQSWDAARNEIVQGMWIELRSGINTDGDWVPKGTSYGNHKSLIFLDSAYWRSVLAGKQILEVKLHLQRKNTGHGYPNDGRYIKVWTHNYDSRPAGEPWLGNGTEIWNTNFGRGDARWITLPNSFGEGLRDGWARGFALHTDFRTADTDRYTYCRFDEGNTYVYIKYK
jgi:hypothetical protein